jgi:hypothetical protein
MEHNNSGWRSGEGRGSTLAGLVPKAEAKNAVWRIPAGINVMPSG